MHSHSRAYAYFLLIESKTWKTIQEKVRTKFFANCSLSCNRAESISHVLCSLKICTEYRVLCGEISGQKTQQKKGGKAFQKIPSTTPLPTLSKTSLTVNRRYGLPTIFIISSTTFVARELLRNIVSGVLEGAGVRHDQKINISKKERKKSGRKEMLYYPGK